MAIGPIPDIRPLDVMQTGPADLELGPVNRVDGSARTADSPSRRRQPAQRRPEDLIDDTVAVPIEPEAVPAASLPPIALDEPDHQINLFA